MVLAYHLIVTAYGFWLPNDPRGSWSDFVREWELLRFGPATKVDTHRSVAGRPHDRSLRAAAKESLRYPPVSFTGHQARDVANGFANCAQKYRYILYACAVLPEHAHLVVARHDKPIEHMTEVLKAAATRELRAQGRHPLAAYPKRDGSLPSPWARNQWAVYLDDEADIVRAVRYVERNPEKEGKPPQRWSFVTPYVI